MCGACWGLGLLSLAVACWWLLSGFVVVADCVWLVGFVAFAVISAGGCGCLVVCLLDLCFRLVGYLVWAVWFGCVIAGLGVIVFVCFDGWCLAYGGLVLVVSGWMVAGMFVMFIVAD